MSSRKSPGNRSHQLVDIETAKGNVRGTLQVSLLFLACMWILAWWGLEAGKVWAAAILASVAAVVPVWRYFIERAARTVGREEDWLGLFRQFRRTALISAGLWVMAALTIYPHLDDTKKVVFLFGVALALATTALHFAGHPWFALGYVAALIVSLIFAVRESFQFEPLVVIFLVVCLTVWRRLFVTGTVRTVDLASRMARAMAARRLWSERAQRRVHAAEVRSARARSEAAESRALFVARISHELRTPLQTIVSGLELLQQRASSSASTDHMFASLLERLSRSTDQVLVLSHDLADFIRWESGTLPVRLVDVDVPRLMDDIAANLAERARLRGVRLGVEHFGQPGAARSDPARLRAIITNLLTNAIKYAPNGNVRLGTEGLSDGTWVVTVQDDGPGLPGSVLEVLGSPWTRGDNARVQEEGFGLGLSIVMTLAQEVGIRVAVSSQPGSTGFFLTLPAPGAGDAQ